MLKKIVFLIFLFAILLVPFTTFAGSPQGAAAPSIPDLFDSSQNSSPYLTDYQGNYYLDDTAGMFDPVEKVLNATANIIFADQMGVCYLIIIAFYFAFNFSFIDIFKPIIGNVVESMQGQVFNKVSIIILSFLGLYYFIKTIQKQQAQFFQTLVYTIIVTACATYYFTHPIQIIEGVDDFTTNVSKMVLQGTNNGSTPGNDAVITSSNDIWEIFVHKPWEYLEFGDKALATQYSDRVLRLSPTNDSRKTIFENLEQDGKWQNMGLDRIGFELMYLIPMAVTLVILAALCLLTIGYQFLTMLIFMMGIFIFILALIPGNSNLVVTWFQRLLGAAFTKIVLSFVLTLMIAFNRALFIYANSSGWLVMLILQLIIYIMIYYKRNEIIELFLLFKVAMINPGMAANRMLAKVGDSNFSKERSSIKGISRKLLRSDKVGSFEPKHKKTNYDEDSVSISPQNIARSNSSASYTEVTESPSSGAYQEGSENQRSGSGIIIKSEQLESQSQEPQGHKQEHNDLRALLNKAEKILEKQVEILRQEAERKAQQKGKSVEYPSEVKRADNRRLMGLQPFDRREVAQTAREIQRIERAGGNANELLRRPERKEVQRPPNVISIMNRMGNRPTNTSSGGGFYGTDTAKEEKATGTEGGNVERPVLIRQQERQQAQQPQPQQPQPQPQQQARRERPEKQVGVRVNPNKSQGKKLRG